MSAAPLSEWEYVSVDAKGRVTHLNLYDNNLHGITFLTCTAANPNPTDDMNAGNIPAELSQLSNLKWVGLSNNNLSGIHMMLSLM